MSRNQQLDLYQINKNLLHSANRVQLIRSKIVLANRIASMSTGALYKSFWRCGCTSQKYGPKGAVVTAVFGPKDGHANGPRDRNELSHPSSIVK